MRGDLFFAVCAFIASGESPDLLGKKGATYINAPYVPPPPAYIQPPAPPAYIQPSAPGYIAVQPSTVISARPKFREAPATARAYDISEPVYTCPKPGYILKGEECIFEDSVPSKLQCPPGYVEHASKHTTICERVTKPALTCPIGVLRNGACVVNEYSDVVLRCPVDSTPGLDGTCFRLETLPAREICPDGATPAPNGQCVIYEYHEPTFVCPPDTWQEGHRCRREIVTYKGKDKEGKRQLSAEEDEVAAADAEEETLEGNAYEEDLFDNDLEIPVIEEQGVKDYYVADDWRYGGRGDWGAGRDWVPAPVTGKMKKGKYYHEGEFRGDYVGGVYGGGRGDYAHPGYAEQLKWQKIHVQVPAVKAAKGPKGGKPFKSQVVRVVTQAAERVCEVGARHGSHCVTQTLVAPVVECPVALVNGACVRKTSVAPISTCTVGTLVCPPRLPGNVCKCETSAEVPAVLSCPIGGQLERDVCIATAAPVEYCPIGYILNTHSRLCIKRDVEPALCLFTVTYTCPDCDLHTPDIPLPLPLPHPIPHPIPLPPVIPHVHTAIKSKKAGKYGGVGLYDGGVRYGGKGVYVLGDGEEEELDQEEPELVAQEESA